MRTAVSTASSWTIAAFETVANCTDVRARLARAALARWSDARGADADAAALWHSADTPALRALLCPGGRAIDDAAVPGARRAAVAAPAHLAVKLSPPPYVAVAVAVAAVECEFRRVGGHFNVTPIVGGSA